jgi:hypothetical protein
MPTGQDIARDMETAFQALPVGAKPTAEPRRQIMMFIRKLLVHQKLSQKNIYRELFAHLLLKRIANSTFVVPALEHRTRVVC